MVKPGGSSRLSIFGGPLERTTYQHVDTEGSVGLDSRSPNSLGQIPLPALDVDIEIGPGNADLQHRQYQQFTSECVQTQLLEAHPEEPNFATCLVVLRVLVVVVHWCRNRLKGNFGPRGGGDRVVVVTRLVSVLRLWWFSDRP